MSKAIPSGARRLDRELAVLGLLVLLWILGVVQGLAWLVIVLDVDVAPDPAWGRLVASSVLGCVIAGLSLVADLPATRWPDPRQASATAKRRSATRWLVPFAWLLAPLALWLSWRDRRRTDATSKPDEVELAYAELSRLPRTAGLKFMTWHALAALVAMLILGTQADWPRPTIGLGTAIWAALTAPLVALLVGVIRAILRPDLRGAPRTIDQFSRRSDLRFRVGMVASIAALGAVLAPLLSAFAWNEAGRMSAGPLRAQAVAETLLTLTEDGAGLELGRALGRNPEAVVQVGSRRFGDADRPIPPHAGEIDLDGDGSIDVVVVHRAVASAVVPVDPPLDRPTTWLLVGALVLAATTVGATFIVAGDLRRDVQRASSQVEAVASGRAPTPLVQGSFSTAELRQLVLAVDHLVQRTTEANVEKYVAIEKAKEADRLKNQFLANMSHDLRSPLNSILGFSELLTSGIDGDLTSEQREMVEHIHDSGKHLLRQIDDILDTAKLEAGRLDFDPEPTPGATLVGRAIHQTRKRRPSSIGYEVDVAPGLPPAFVDPYRTVQALENVLTFASERMSEGSLAIRVRLGTSRRGQVLFVQVRTPVRPATAQQLARARRGFFRIPGHAGLGLGLPIAGSILELQGGALSIEDLGEEGGMIFTLELRAPRARRGTGPVREVSEAR